MNVIAGSQRGYLVVDEELASRQREGLLRSIGCCYYVVNPHALGHAFLFQLELRVVNIEYALVIDTKQYVSRRELTEKDYISGQLYCRYVATYVLDAEIGVIGGLYGSDP